MFNKFLMTFFCLLFVLIFSSSLFAHATHVHANGFISGIGHPVLGLDHLLAMLAVGVISIIMGGQSIWRVPLIFVLFMLVGSLIGHFYSQIPWVEYGIVFSVISLGLAIAFWKKDRYFVSFFLIALFGLFHGYAHGAEMPSMVDPLLYGAGFVTGTIILHLCGVLIGFVMNKIPGGKDILRLSGSVMSAVGVYFFANLIV